MKPSELPQVDLAIIGGGINGAGLAAQAAQAGLSVALFEKGDFASGTSSKSTKLLHGGIRYLEQYRFGLVFEGLHERQRLLRMAPHLARPIPFLLPVYRGDVRPPWMLKLGLWLYDILAGTQNIAKHQWFSPTEALKKAPTLNPQGLKGCGLYFDAQVNDARLVWENILAAREAGAHCFNYCRVGQIDKEPGYLRLFGQDERTGESWAVKTSCLVNASGPWANQTAQMISTDNLKLVRPTRGTHIVVPEVLPQHAVLITTQKDDRVIFVIPWRGYSLVGTTDLDDSEDPDKTHPTEEEIQYLLNEAARIFPGTNWDRDQVLAAFAGLRPLAWTDRGHASAVSREDKILQEGNLLNIVGGKLTTYHAMATKALGLALKVVGKAPHGTPSFNLPGTPETTWNNFQETSIPQWVSTYKITPTQATQLAHLYGRRALQVLELLKEDKAWGKPLDPERPELVAQVVFAVRVEEALHLEDVMLRRLELGYSPQRWGEASKKASQVMAKLLGWNEETRKKELERYRQSLYPAPS